MDMNSLLDGDLGGLTDKVDVDTGNAGNTLKTRVVARIDDIFSLCANNSSQLHSLVQMVKTMSTKIVVLEEEVRQLKTTVTRTDDMIGSVSYADNHPETGPTVHA